jgi:hypothetical protein
MVGRGEVDSKGIWTEMGVDKWASATNVQLSRLRPSQCALRRERRSRRCEQKESEEMRRNEG